MTTYQSNDYLKAILQYMLPKQRLTMLAGCLANVKIPLIKNYLIRRFIQNYDVNMQEAYEKNYMNYACFNDFFIRHLDPSARSMANTAIISPVDGCISEIGDIKIGQLLQAKGHNYSVHELLACPQDISAKFEHGRFVTLYLSPKDYHRVHMPIDATLQTMVYVPGKLFSVQPATTRMIPQLFARNERVVAIFNTDLGLMAMVLVGATIVGNINTRWHGDMRRGRQLQQFDYSNQEDSKIFLPQATEMGYFKLGSTVIVLFEDKKRMQWCEHLTTGDNIRFGDALGI